MEEEIEESGGVGYPGIEFGWPPPHDAFGGHKERVFCELIAPQKRFHHPKVVGSSPAPQPVRKSRRLPAAFSFSTPLLRGLGLTIRSSQRP
jgi:hypothetical protein